MEITLTPVATVSFGEHAAKTVVQIDTGSRYGTLNATSCRIDDPAGRGRILSFTAPLLSQSVLQTKAFSTRSGRLYTHFSIAIEEHEPVSCALRLMSREGFAHEVTLGADFFARFCSATGTRLLVSTAQISK